MGRLERGSTQEVSGEKKRRQVWLLLVGVSMVRWGFGGFGFAGGGHSYLQGR